MNCSETCLRFKAIGGYMMRVSIRCFLCSLLVLAALCGQARAGVTLVQRWDGATKGDGFGFFVNNLNDSGNGQSVLNPRQDGITDIIISKACNGYNCPAAEGSVTVYSGKDFSMIFQITGMAWSYAVDAGDLNGDGVPDLLVSELFPTGRVRAYSGSDGSPVPSLAVYGDKQAIDFGNGLSGIGDITGDGVPDLIVGDGEASLPGAGGYAVILSGADGSTIARLDNPDKENLKAEFGRSISEAGDIDGDGTQDFIVGSPGASPRGITNAGSAYVFSGRRDLGFPRLYRLNGENSGDRLDGGCGSAAPVGDLNSDGKPELAVTAQWASPGSRTNAGSVYVFDGGSGEPLPRFDGNGVMRFEGENAGDYLGGTAGYECGWIAVAGDINGDGYPDFITGAPGTDVNGVPDAGRVLVFSGYDASVLNRIDNPDPAYTPHYFGGNGAVVGGLDGSGTVRVVIGAGDPFTGPREAGASYLFNLSGSSQTTSASSVIYNGQAQGFTAKIITGRNEVWMTNSPETTIREKRAAGTFRGIVYVIEDAGDPKSVTVSIYDPVGNTWKTVPPMSFPRSGAAIGVIGNFLYVAGGFDDNGLTATVEAYDPVSNAWTTKATMPAARSGASVGVVGSFFYVIGGYDGKGPVVTVEAYDPVSNAWTAKAPMSRVNPATGVANGILYCVWPSEGGGSLLEAYDSVSGAWASKAPLSTSSMSFTVSVSNGTLYVGGADMLNDPAAGADAYDPVSDTWKNKAPYGY